MIMTRKILLLFVMIVFPFGTSAQDKLSVVTLKNGTEIKGVIKSIDPTDALKMIIAGVEISIKMNDVAKVEELINKMERIVPQLTQNKKLVVTDMEDYPDSIFINICGTKIKMILVRGGDMNMGYDGKGSMDMNSEPIHRVSVTSFYISNTCITSILAKQLTDKKVSDRTFYIAKWEDINTMTQTIAQRTGIPVRMPTEAEWEFAACSEQQNLIFKYNDDDEFCSDYFGKFNTLSESTIDPTGPISGRRHVVRYYGKGNNKFDRDHSDSENRLRLVVKAKDI